MKKNQRKTFYYISTITVSLLGLILASSINIQEVVFRGLLGIAILLLTIFYVAHTDQGGSFNEPFHLPTFTKSTLLLFILAIIVSWAIEDVFNLFFYMIGI